MARYRKKPVVVEAVQFDGGEFSAGQIVGWIGDEATYVKPLYEHPMRYNGELDHSTGYPKDNAPGFLVITTLEGEMRADVDDWIIRGVSGEFYPCKPDIFEQTYEPADG